VNRILAKGTRYPLIFLYELEGDQSGEPDIDNPVGDESFAYNEMCLETVDYCILETSTRRTDNENCNVFLSRFLTGNVLRDDTMREAIPLDSDFPRLTLRSEAAGLNKVYHESARGLDSEVYNPQYFLEDCEFTPTQSRNCFEPIYGLECFDTEEPIYNQPVAFWTSAFADRVADVPGAVGARSVVFGFAPVFFNPNEVKPAIEYILFDEWQLPRKVQ
jgi:hypothetical protein